MFILLAIIAFLAPTRSWAQAEVPTLSQVVQESFACGDARDILFDQYERAYLGQRDLSGAKFRSDIFRLMQSKGAVFRSLVPDEQNLFYTKMMSLHALFTTELELIKSRTTYATRASSVGAAGEVEPDVSAEGESDPLLHLARLEMRSEIDPAYGQLNLKIDRALAENVEFARSIGMPCEKPGATAGPVSELPEPPSAVTVQNSPRYGALYTMATSYQSCQVLDRPVVIASTESAAGVRKGATIDGVGYGRVYTDVALLNRTHYYHRDQTYSGACIDQSAKPLVYDYGGVPVITDGASLNMFANSGGGSALGIDCSAFVSTSAAVAGNRYREQNQNRPVYTRFVSRDFIDPVKSGWNCYESVQTEKTTSIQPGDIAAVEGHVVMIDEVGADPFSLANVKTIAGCKSLDFQNFDFSILQSSPDKGSLGINRFRIRDYLKSGTKMANLFVGYGRQACLSSFDGTTRNPKTRVYGMIRHKQTLSCVAPRISLDHEECVQSCPGL